LRLPTRTGSAAVEILRGSIPAASITALFGGDTSAILNDRPIRMMSGCDTYSSTSRPLAGD
jgi:hypothetical protein